MKSASPTARDRALSASTASTIAASWSSRYPTSRWHRQHHRFSTQPCWHAPATKHRYGPLQINAERTPPIAGSAWDWFDTSRSRGLARPYSFLSPSRQAGSVLMLAFHTRRLLHYRAALRTGQNERV